jgi:murein DD-endopeptidase MepM/ murein hydrolase activator NlpD
LAALLWLAVGGLLLAWARPLHAQENVPYTVVAGDTLGEIATRFGVSLESLVAANGIADPNLLEVGQVLLIPSGQAAAAGVLAADLVTVRARPGDTLAAVAARYGRPLEQIGALNGLSETARLFPGEPLLLPRAAVTPEPLRFGAITAVQIPGQLIQGRTGRLVVHTQRPLALVATWNDLPLSFTPVAGDPLRQAAYLPVPALIAPNAYWLAVAYTATNGLVLRQSWPVAVVEGPYQTEVIDLPPDRGELLQDPVQVRAEEEKVAAILAEHTPGLLWTQIFSRPVDVQYQTSSAFGTRRSYDGGPVSSYHAGQDFSVPPDIPVVAPGDAVVALAEPLIVRGNAVILNHGGGVYTGYWHLNEIKVTPGQMVKQGEVLGLVGNTGLSTGAHLHWEMRIFGIAVDPMQFLDEPLGLVP